jgi:hypothetical protein
MPTKPVILAKPSKSIALDPMPTDAVPLKRAAFLACMSRASLLRRASKGRIREWRRDAPGDKGRYYSEAECRALAPRRVK